MDNFVFGFGAFVVLSLLSSAVVLFALARSSQISHREEEKRRRADRDRQSEPELKGGMQSKRVSAT